MLAGVVGEFLRGAQCQALHSSDDRHSSGSLPGGEGDYLAAFGIGQGKKLAGQRRRDQAMNPDRGAEINLPREAVPVDVALVSEGRLQNLIYACQHRSLVHVSVSLRLFLVAHRLYFCDCPSCHQLPRFAHKGLKMPIVKIEAIPVRIKREEAYLGAAPRGADENAYFLRPPYRALYSRYLETAFVKITTDEGVFGWGEALAPVAPQVVCAIVEQLLAPALMNRDPLDGNALWNVMYDLMRERGYYGGFMLDAISACDTALWDLRGKLLGQPVYKLLGGAFRERVPCYVSGLPKPTAAERVELAQGYVEEGYSAFKLAAGHGVSRGYCQRQGAARRAWR